VPFFARGAFLARERAPCDCFDRKLLRADSAALVSELLQDVLAGGAGENIAEPSGAQSLIHGLLEAAMGWLDIPMLMGYEGLRASGPLVFVCATLQGNPIRLPQGFLYALGQHFIDLSVETKG
jgi:hypothetical protein